MKFELVYSDGGHDGPYGDIIGALRAAVRKAAGFQHDNHIEVYDRAGELYNKQYLRFTVGFNALSEEIAIFSYTPIAGYEKIDEFSLDSDSGRLYTGCEQAENDEFLKHHGVKM